jgi:uncharacterized protein (DUF2225 family)
MTPNGSRTSGPCRRTRAAFASLLALAICDHAFGTILGREDITCPVCGQTFSAVVPVSTDTSAGVDRDLFARSAGPQPVFYLISTCPRCYYSGYLEDFRADLKLPKVFRDKVVSSPKLDPGMTITPKTDQRKIPAPTRYRLAYQCYEWRGMTAESMAWLCLRASWVERDLGSVMPRTDRLQRVMGFVERYLPSDSPKMNQADREMRLSTHLLAQIAEGRFTVYQQPFVRFVLAMMWRRHGENDLFAAVTATSESQRPLPIELQSKLAEVRESISREQQWQRLSLESFLKALDGGEISETNRPAAQYLVAELYRRLGQKNRSVLYFDRILANANADTQLRAWALQQRDVAISRSH